MPNVAEILGEGWEADGVYGFTSNRQNQTETKATLPSWTGDDRDAAFFGRWGVGWSVLVLPRQLTHHFEQSFVLLFELLVLVLNVVQVLQRAQNSRNSQTQT